MSEYIHIDTFSGIGGFPLAAGWAGFTTRLMCEIEPYCRAVLAKHWPDTPCHDDIRTLDADTLRRYGIRDVALLTGGPPCQPASVAGQRKGAQDERWLWPEFLRLVRTIRPLYVLAENPRGLCSLELENLVGKPNALDWVRDEFSAAGYQSEVYLLAADDVGAPHQRERVWIVGHTESNGGNGEVWNNGREAIRETMRAGRNVAHSESGKTLSSEPGRLYAEPAVLGDKLADAEGFLPERAIRSGNRFGKSEAEIRDGGLPLFPPARNDFGGWAAVAGLDASLMPCTERKILSVDDGLSAGLDRRRRRARNATLKAAGNAIVPQVAYPILAAIMEQLRRHYELCPRRHAA